MTCSQLEIRRRRLGKPAQNEPSARLPEYPRLIPKQNNAWTPQYQDIWGVTTSQRAPIPDCCSLCKMFVGYSEVSVPSVERLINPLLQQVADDAEDEAFKNV
jgi:hypothetical protein